VRRIEALTGEGALQYEQKREGEWRELAGLLKTSPHEVIEKTKKLLTSLRETERALEQAKQKALEQQGAGQEATIRDVNGVPVLVKRIDGLNMQELRTFSDTLRHKVDSGLLVLGSAHDDKVALLVIVGKDRTKQLPAGKIAQHIAQFVGGSGGGRPDMAQAGGNQPEHLDLALEKVYEYVATQLG
jgi:alanyl-tRNA synthetase